MPADLHVDVPRREPPDAFVARLAALAAAGAPAPAAATVRAGRWRAWTGQAMAVAAVLLLILGAIVLGGRSDRAAPAPATTPTPTGPRVHVTPTLAPREPGLDDTHHGSTSVADAYPGTAERAPASAAGDPVGSAGHVLGVAPERGRTSDPEPVGESPDLADPTESSAPADVADDPVGERGGDDAE